MERPPISLAQALSTLKAEYIRNAKIKGGAIVNPVKNLLLTYEANIITVPHIHYTADTKVSN